MSLLLLLAVKVGAVLVASLLAIALLRRRSAAVRHWVLATAMACAAAMPVLTLVVPSWSAWPAPAAPQRPSPADAGVDVAVTSASPSADAAPLPAAQDAGPAVDARRLAALAWVAGFAATSLGLLLGLARLRRLSRASTSIDDPRWQRHLADLCLASGVRRDIRLLESVHPALVVTWGTRRPAILLPADARQWTDERIRVVLGHELAHIRRGDWAVLLVAQIVRALHWFNPLAWLACRRLRLESEHACDDAVLGLGVTPPAYAAHLLDLARAAHGGAWSPALPVARPSGLERRVHAMLDGSLNRRPLTRASRVAIAGAVLLFAGAAAGIGAAQGGFSTVTGSLTDPSGAALPAVTMTITNSATDTKTTLKTTRTGGFEFVGLPPGEYVLEAVLPGFRNHRERLALDGQLVQREITMPVGFVEEFVTITAAPAAPSRPAMQVARRAPRPCTSTPQAAGGPPVGGNIRPPMKLRDVRPLYPPALRDAKVGGVVRIETKIATDGSVRDMRPVPGEHPDLVRAAMDAVGQWQFAETLLNCQPIEVDMTVRVSFDPAG